VSAPDRGGADDDAGFRVPAYRVELVRTHTVRSRFRFRDRPAGIARVFRRTVGCPDREHLVAFYFDADTRLIGLHVAAVGDVNVVHCAPGAVFKAALLCNAASVVLAHNHPSGRTAPSPADVAFTHQMELGGAMLDVPVLDHVVVGARGHLSLRETGQMLTPPAGGDWTDTELEARWTRMSPHLPTPTFNTPASRP
jgi:DNA repair protein RadC